MGVVKIWCNVAAAIVVAFLMPGCSDSRIEEDPQVLDESAPKVEVEKRRRRPSQATVAKPASDETTDAATFSAPLTGEILMKSGARPEGTTQPVTDITAPDPRPRDTVPATVLPPEVVSSISEVRQVVTAVEKPQTAEAVTRASVELKNQVNAIIARKAAPDAPLSEQQKGALDGFDEKLIDSLNDAETSGDPKLYEAAAEKLRRAIEESETVLRDKSGDALQPSS